MTLLIGIVVILLIATVRYADDTRDARDWSTPYPLAHHVSTTHHLGGAPTPRGDIIRVGRFVARAARAVARKRHTAATPSSGDNVIGCCTA